MLGLCWRLIVLVAAKSTIALLLKAGQSGPGEEPDAVVATGCFVVAVMVGTSAILTTAAASAAVDDEARSRWGLFAPPRGHNGH